MKQTNWKKALTKLRKDKIVHRKGSSLYLQMVAEIRNDGDGRVAMLTIVDYNTMKHVTLRPEDFHATDWKVDNNRTKDERKRWKK